MKKKQEVRPADWRFLAALLITCLAIGGVIFYLFAPRLRPRPTSEQVQPPYFVSVEAAKPFPQTLDPSQFSSKDIAAAYLGAKKAPGVLAQQPCFCHCHRIGHRSLLDCFATQHGAECDVCVKEALFADQESRNGKSAGQIRQEILQGAWQVFQFVN